jgi:hypothetical protein
MISEELKEIIDLAGGRYIIVEDGRPKYIIMSFAEYRETFLDKNKIKSLTEKELVAKINSDIAFWRESRQDKQEELAREIEKIEDVEYEVLPK